MKIVLLLAALTIATPALAQTAPAPAPAAPVTAAKFSLDTPIETLAADPAAKAVLDANFPGLTTHQAYDMFKAMSLKQVAPMSGGQISDESLAKTGVGLAAIK
jgi:hypothetical protein